MTAAYTTNATGDFITTIYVQIMTLNDAGLSRVMELGNVAVQFAELLYILHLLFES